MITAAMERSVRKTKYGKFIDSGYVAYHGAVPLEELMMDGSAEQGFQMGGMT